MTGTHSPVGSLAVETPGELDIVVTRRFNAPLDLIWRAYTEPDLVRRWLIGSPDWTMPVCEIDLRPGGSYLYRWRHKESADEFGFAGIFHEIDRPNQIAADEWPDGENGLPPARNVITFTALGEMTELKMIMTYASAEIRTMVLQTGMTDGMGLSFDMLDALAEKLVSP